MCVCVSVNAKIKVYKKGIKSTGKIAHKMRKNQNEDIFIFIKKAT